jgi:hypoxanthine phosphoribosyltransferase
MNGKEKHIGNSLEQLKISPRFKLRETEYEGITYVCPTWNQMGEFNFNLAKQIIESEQSFNRLVALARGGWTWARDLADALKIPELSSVRIKSYTGVNESGKPRIVQPLTDSISGEKILLFDEVIDSGVTIKKAQEYLKVMGANDIQTAALCYKPRSEIKPEFFAFDTNAWVVFPHEIREFIEESNTKWKAEGKTSEEIKNRLVNIGVPKNQVDFYSSISK